MASGKRPDRRSARGWRAHDDAVKQQLFVIQTKPATAQARFDSDANGAKTAVDRVVPRRVRR